MGNRQKIIDAAARVYGEVGFRAATTRRIASEAGVNEVTLFRIFGSKAALLAEAVRSVAEPRASLPALPGHPGDAEEELNVWAAARLAEMSGKRSMILTLLSEMHGHPEIAECAECAREGPSLAHAQLCAYLGTLRRSGRMASDVEPHAAAFMLHGTLFADAMGRGHVRGLFPVPESAAPAQYVRMFLRGIGYRAAGEAGGVQPARPVRGPRIASRRRSR